MSINANISVPERVLWAPQAGPQHTLVKCQIREILFGGARGGGKSDGVLGKYLIKQQKWGRNFNGIVMRPEMPQSDDMLERAQDLFCPAGARFNISKSQFVFAGGGRLRFRALESVKDAGKYQGQNITDITIEEAGNYPNSEAIDRMFGVLRSTAGVPTQLIMTANPGGPGQQWIRRRFIDPNPAGNEPLNVTLPNGAVHQRIYIPSRVQDNKILLDNDPDYINNLYLVGAPQLVDAWLNGDWGAIQGAFFDWSQDLILKPFTIPSDWQRFLSFDWGSAAPFSCGWWAVALDDRQAETITGKTVTIPRGAIVRYKEWYGAKKDQAGATVPNKGLKLTAEAVAAGIMERTTPIELEMMRGSVADPACFASDGGPSIMERMHKAAPIRFRRADNKRVGKAGALGGWDQMRQMMKNDQMFWFPTCADSIRTIPALQHDDNRPEDLDTKAEDHAADETRYAAMSRAKPRKQLSDEDRFEQGLRELQEGKRETFNEMVERIGRQRRAREG